MLTTLEGTLRDYPWGTTGGISEVLRRAVGPVGGTEAEYWLSAGGVLLKVLSAARPLSLQVHPAANLAESGFDRENASGVPIEAAERSFKDRAAKSEMILALSDRFEALVGFVPADDARRRFALLCETTEASAPGAIEFFRLLQDDATLGDAFVWLVSGSDAARAFADAMLAVITALPEGSPVQAWMAQLHPGDAGVVASLLLNHVVLAAGESLAVEPGTIHAYLHGTGLEVMVESDNVLRAGLTSKHIDVAQLGEALTRRSAPPQRPEVIEFSGGVEHRFPIDGGTLAISVISGDAVIAGDGSAIALVLAGDFVITAGGESIEMGPGVAVHVADEGALEISGSGTLYLAR